VEGQVYACSWQLIGTTYRVWWTKRPRVHAEGVSFEEADQALWEAIMEATGDGENTHEYDPPAPRSDGQQYASNDLILASGETYAWMATHDGVFDGGLCADCYHPLGARTNEALRLDSLQSGPRNGGWVKIRRPAHRGPRITFVSAAFRSLLTAEEDSQFEWRPIVGPPRSRKQWFELIAAQLSIPYVAPVGVGPVGWQCEVCGFESQPFVSKPGAGHEHWNVSMSDLPAMLPSVFALGTAPDFALAFTRARWRTVVGNDGAQGYRSLAVGVLPDHLVDVASERPSYQALLRRAAEGKATSSGSSSDLGAS
jgi:hypothetical protein